MTSATPLTRYSDSEILCALILGKTSLRTHHAIGSEFTELPVTREDLLDELSRRPWVNLQAGMRSMRCPVPEARLTLALTEE